MSDTFQMIVPFGPINLCFFFYLDADGYCACVTDLKAGRAGSDKEITVKSNEGAKEVSVSSLSAEERIRLALVEGFYWLNDNNSPKLNPDYVEAAKQSLKALGLALGLQEKTRNS